MLRVVRIFYRGERGLIHMQTISTDTTNRFESDGRYFIRAASVAELEQRPFKVVTLEDRHILLLRADGRIRALDSRCPHMGYPLSDRKSTRLNSSHVAI